MVSPSMSSIDGRFGFSIAVLPFENLSDDPKQEYISDGLTDDLITDLSKISGLHVISRDATSIYKGTPVNIQKVASELGVRYVLEGSIRKAEERVRINGSRPIFPQLLFCASLYLR